MARSFPTCRFPLKYRVGRPFPTGPSGGGARPRAPVDPTFPPTVRRCLVSSVWTVSTRPTTLPAILGPHHCDPFCLERNQDSVSDVGGLKGSGKQKLGSRKRTWPGAEVAKSHQAKPASPVFKVGELQTPVPGMENRRWSWHAEPGQERGRAERGARADPPGRGAGGRP